MGSSLRVGLVSDSRVVPVEGLAGGAGSASTAGAGAGIFGGVVEAGVGIGSEFAAGAAGVGFVTIGGAADLTGGAINSFGAATWEGEPSSRNFGADEAL